MTTQHRISTDSNLWDEIWDGPNLWDEIWDEIRLHMRTGEFSSCRTRRARFHRKWSRLKARRDANLRSEGRNLNLIWLGLVHLN